MELQWSNVCVKIGGKEILHNVTGSVLPGELLAIMGPSGAGKTTLLNALNGRLPYQGEIRAGDTTLKKSVQRKMCYVLQQEFFFANLTLKETLEFTAMIRLPDTMSKQKKMSHLQTVVDTLDLNKCLETNMGDLFTPGLSGGEKKRASIACELICDPGIIFLDEPTTGLDSSTATSLISLLKTYVSESGKSVIASIHQPSSQNFFQFDKLQLLTGGQVAYFGETNKVVEYFQSVGIDIEENYNPADFILEALSESEDMKTKLLEATHVRTSWLQKGRMFLEDKNGKITDTDASYSDMDPGSVRMSLLDLENIENNHGTEQKWPTGFCTQYTQLTLRTFRESRRRILDKTKLLENLLICGFVSLIFFQLPRNEETLRDRMGALFFIAAHWGFIPLFDAVTSFPLERMVINKERSAHWYRLSAYYLAKMTSELVLIIVQPTVFVIIAYWVIGLNGIGAFFSTLGTVYIDSIAGQSFGLFVGIACMQVNQSMTVSITLQMAIMLLGGLFTRNIPVWLDWMKYLSFLQYSFHSLMVLEFKNGKPLKCLSPKESSAFTVCQTPNTTEIPSNQILEYYDIGWPYWEYILPLVFFAFLFRTLGYLTLRYYRKPF